MQDGIDAARRKAGDPYRAWEPMVSENRFTVIIEARDAYYEAHKYVVEEMRNHSGTMDYSYWFYWPPTHPQWQLWQMSTFTYKDN